MHFLSQRFRVAAVASLAAAAFLTAPAALAADVTDIGFVDQGAIAALPSFQRANDQLRRYDQQLQAQLAPQARHASQAQQQQLAQKYRTAMGAKQRELFGPLFGKAQVAIASVASSKNLSVIVDKRIVVFGGTNITQQVVDLLSGAGDPVPPVSTPAPSSVGYVDENAISQLPKVQQAQADFVKFKNDEDKSAQAKMRAAKTDADREAVLKDYKSTLDAKQDQTIKPVADQAKSVIADVAKKKNLVLVIDRASIIYGGQDITSDVTAAIK